MPAVRSTSIRQQDLVPAPIRPEWVIAGQPQARAVELAASPDGTCTTAHWDCTAGSFHWFFWVEETIHILEGEVTVRDASGQACVLRAGDVAVMPANAWMVWQVERYVRKLAICRYPAGRNLARLMRWSQQLRSWLLMRRPPTLTAAMPH
jgi:uncharacterized cupin superfamily protein